MTEKQKIILYQLLWMEAVRRMGRGSGKSIFHAYYAALERANYILAAIGESMDDIDLSGLFKEG